MTRKQKRFAGIGVIGAVIGLAIFLVSVALRDEIVFFYDPTEVVSGTKVSPGQNFRIGGLVEDGSVVKTNTSFIAQNVLAKHDENYIPKELEDVMKDKNIWKGQEVENNS